MNDCVITILTGLVHTGKTTYLINQYSGKENVYGIITPVINGKRLFQNITMGETFSMEAQIEEESLSIGRYQFSKEAFTKAIGIMEEALKQNEGTLILDEVGPLELQGEGFYGVMKKLVANSNRSLKKIIVVRESILEEVIVFFQIKNYHIIRP